jgi:hypothetical protein
LACPHACACMPVGASSTSHARPRTVRAHAPLSTTAARINVGHHHLRPPPASSRWSEPPTRMQRSRPGPDCARARALPLPPGEMYEKSIVLPCVKLLTHVAAIVIWMQAPHCGAHRLLSREPGSDRTGRACPPPPPVRVLHCVARLRGAGVSGAPLSSQLGAALRFPHTHTQPSFCPRVSLLPQSTLTMTMTTDHLEQRFPRLAPPHFCDAAPCTPPPFA